LIDRAGRFPGQKGEPAALVRLAAVRAKAERKAMDDGKTQQIEDLDLRMVGTEKQ